ADQVVRADQVGLELGELAFVKGGKLLKQELARDQAKHRITQELKLLIIEFFHCSFRAACLGLFMGMRAMRKRAFQHLRMLEAMARRGLYRGQIGLHNDCIHCGSAGPALRDPLASPASRSCSASASFCSSGFELASCNACSTELSAAMY